MEEKESGQDIIGNRHSSHSAFDTFSDDDDDPSYVLPKYFFHDLTTSFGKQRHEIMKEYVNHFEKLQQSVSNGYKNGFQSEYQMCCNIDQLPQYINDISHQTRATKRKNRYFDVLPYESTRVHLPNPDPSDPAGDYMNANYIQGITSRENQAYIACSAPPPPAINDFWSLVYHKRIRVILMLTNFVEREMLKADYYWDPNGNVTTYGSILVQLIHEEAASVGYIIRTFEISSKTHINTKQYVKQIQMTIWPDHGALKEFSIIGPMLRHFNSLNMEKDDNGNVPSIVHCSAGIGRSGTFIAIDLILKRLHLAMEEFEQCKITEEKCLENLQKALSISSIVMELRCQRPGMVQTLAQYQMIYEFLRDVLLGKY